MGNSDSELTDSSSQSDSESYSCNIADAEIDTEKDVPQEAMHSFFRKVSKDSHKKEQKKIANMKYNKEVK